MSARYSDPVPVDIVKLEYLGVEFEMWAAAGNQRKLDQIAAEIQRTWLSVRPEVLANGGTFEAREFDETVKHVEQAVSPGQYERLARTILDRAGDLKKVFA